MNCWQHLDKLKHEADMLRISLDAAGWTLLTPSPDGRYRAKKRNSHKSDWREVLGRTAAEVMEAVSNEVRRQEELKRKSA